LFGAEVEQERCRTCCLTCIQVGLWIRRS